MIRTIQRNFSDRLICEFNFTTAERIAAMSDAERFQVGNPQANEWRQAARDLMRGVADAGPIRSPWANDTNDKGGKDKKASVAKRKTQRRK